VSRPSTVSSSGVGECRNRGFLGEMVRHTSRGVSAGDDALPPAVASYWAYQAQLSNKLPNPVLDEIAVPGNACHEPAIEACHAATTNRHYGPAFAE
jgi:hypothetical protein